MNICGQTLTGFTPGQPVNLRVKTANPAGNTYSSGFGRLYHRMELTQTLW